jgi:hypothetical protein
MHRFFCLIVFLIMLIPAGKAQTDIATYIDRLPTVAANVHEAWQQFYPKGKKTVYQQADDLIMAQINALANESNHKSRLLSMLAERYDNEGQRIDFSKVTINKDKELDNKLKEANEVYFYELDNFQRAVGLVLDSVRNKNEPAMIRAQHELEIMQKHLPVFIKKLRRLISQVTTYMDKKGYHAVLVNHQAGHPYYIQLLEVRGLLLSRLRDLNKMAEGASQMAATIADSCKKYPDSCK